MTLAVIQSCGTNRSKVDSLILSLFGIYANCSFEWGDIHEQWRSQDFEQGGSLSSFL